MYIPKVFPASNFQKHWETLQVHVALSSAYELSLPNK